MAVIPAKAVIFIPIAAFLWSVAWIWKAYRLIGNGFMSTSSLASVNCLMAARWSTVFLTLALLPRFSSESMRITDVRMLVNYGLSRVCFPALLPVGSNVRGRLKLLDVSDIHGGAEMVWEVNVEREGEAKPVCVADAIFRRH